MQIVPPFIPASNLPYFKPGIRRVYLTATMLGTDSFIRTFGRAPDCIIKPVTTAGQCERLVLFPTQSGTVESELTTTKKLIENRKALILTSNSYETEKWNNIGKVSTKDTITNDIETFKSSVSVDKLVLASRYDGIDLPGDTCRVMVLDGLPTGTSLLDKYMWESLHLSHMLRSTIACRIVQSMGRISRGLNDFGVVIINGQEYSKWLLTPKNYEYLPSFIQKQIQLGLKISENCQSSSDFSSTVDACLSRDKGWINAYEQFIDDCEVTEVLSDEEKLIELAKSEIKFSIKLWERDYSSATKIFSSSIDLAYSLSSGLGSWYALWLGYCCELMGDNKTAIELYKRSYGATKSIPRNIEYQLVTYDEIPEQIINIANEFRLNTDASVKLPKNIANDLYHLNGLGTVSQKEEALRCLGQYLGLNATRPDKEHGTGPDVLWLLNDTALAIEAKTEKFSNYSKDNIGQLRDHVQWVKDNTKAVNIIPVFVGDILSPTTTSNPSNDLFVAELSEFKRLSEFVVSTLTDISNEAVPINLNQITENKITERGLLWPEIANHIKMYPLASLK